MRIDKKRLIELIDKALEQPLPKSDITTAEEIAEYLIPRTKEWIK